jgi:hypothetical protein
MSRWLLSFAVLLAFTAGPALATVDVLANIDKTKTVDVLEFINIRKDIFIDVDVPVLPTSAAEAEAIINQDNFVNEACENCAEKQDTIRDSANDNSGVITVNQAAGNNNNQGSAIAIAVDTRIEQNGNTDGEDSFAEAQASAQQTNSDSLVEAVNLIFRDTLIENSINNNTGVVHVNQSAGNTNNQANELAIALGLSGAGVALSEAALGQFNAFNTVFESDQDGANIGINKTATIYESVNGNSGVVGVNQTSGNLANQANVVAIAAAQ